MTEFVISLKRGVEPSDLPKDSIMPFADYVREIADVVVLEVFPTGRRLLVSGSGNALGDLRESLARYCRIEPLAKGNVLQDS